MQYILIEFTKGLKEQAYQEVDANGNVVRYTDLKGKALDLPDIYECDVIDNAPDFPEWGVADEAVPQTSFGTTKVGDEVILGDE